MARGPFMTYRWESDDHNIVFDEDAGIVTIISDEQSQQKFSLEYDAMLFLAIADTIREHIPSTA